MRGFYAALRMTISMGDGGSGANKQRREEVRGDEVERLGYNENQRQWEDSLFFLVCDGTAWELLRSNSKDE
jgi:hypothetical protein